ncbi:MAG: acetate/propionate family kinase, partial [Nitrospirales bacterium]|nr:acetate/propionate family kinase [Nitrospirales bacterium]
HMEVDPEKKDIERIRVRGAVKGIGGTGTLEFQSEGEPKSVAHKSIPDHDHAIQWAFETLKQKWNERCQDPGPFKVDAVGHRVVHGGERFSAPVLINEVIEKEIDGLSELAPLHNPACLAGIRGARKVLGEKVPMVGVFDTAFHQTMPPVAKTYALPHKLISRYPIHRYGFHGIAHASLSAGYAAFSGKSLEGTRLITLQLGNGCSVTAIADGKSVETSMGFTPLEGLVMGTRSGDVDPSVVSFLSEREEVDAGEVERWLNEDSGLLGLSGRTNDMRELLSAATHEHDERAQLAIELFCYRVRKYIGAYLAVLRSADAIVFGGGIGEASPDIRARICEGMDWCGLLLDPDRNRACVGLSQGMASEISQDSARVKAYVVAADEETWIAKETVRCLT